jgi:hypothetical protein
MLNSFLTSENSYIRFEWGKAQNNYRSEKAGHPVFDDVLFGYVSSPGQKKSTVAYELIRKDAEGKERRISAHAWEKYGNQIETFLSKGGGGNIGTPIDNLPEVSQNQKDHLKSLNVHTIEALASLSDAGLSNIGMGARDLQARAVYYVNHSKNKASEEERKKLSSLEDENKTLKERLDALEAIVREKSNVSTIPTAPAQKRSHK